MVPQNSKVGARGLRQIERKCKELHANLDEAARRRLVSLAMYVMLQKWPGGRSFNNKLKRAIPRARIFGDVFRCMSLFNSNLDLLRELQATGPLPEGQPLPAWYNLHPAAVILVDCLYSFGAYIPQNPQGHYLRMRVNNRGMWMIVETFPPEELIEKARRHLHALQRRQGDQYETLQSHILNFVDNNGTGGRWTTVNGFLSNIARMCQLPLRVSRRNQDVGIDLEKWLPCTIVFFGARPVEEWKYVLRGLGPVVMVQMAHLYESQIRQLPANHEESSRISSYVEKELVQGLFQKPVLDVIDGDNAVIRQLMAGEYAGIQQPAVRPVENYAGTRQPAVRPADDGSFFRPGVGIAIGGFVILFTALLPEFCLEIYGFFSRNGRL